MQCDDERLTVCIDNEMSVAFVRGRSIAATLVKDKVLVSGRRARLKAEQDELK